ncbi:MAG: 50S ribosomal protein L4 [Planctomycetia bacterium]|nr:50S ribosomal protein L4 [Planctomycetia bacterium]
MANIPIYDNTGKQVGDYEIDVQSLAPVISKPLLHEAVVMYQANMRQGSAKSKTRSEVSGSRKKMYRQKGTGNARAGHKRSGVRKGGGHIFAKTPKDWSYRLPRKALQTATRMALAAKINKEFVKLIDSFSADVPKTKVVVDMLKALTIDSSLLFVIDQYDENVYKSARNIPKLTILPVSDINAYEILRPKQVLMTKGALDKFIAERVKKAEKEA